MLEKIKDISLGINFEWSPINIKIEICIDIKTLYRLIICLSRTRLKKIAVSLSFTDKNDRLQHHIAKKDI